MPSALVIEDRSQFGVYRPGTIITETETGLRRARAYGEHNLATYTLRFTPRSYSTETYEMLMALMHSTAVSVVPFWVKEPISKPRIAVPGEITDGSSTTYINPLDAIAPAVMVGDQRLPGGDATIKSVANLLTDTQAGFVGGSLAGLYPYGAGPPVTEATENPTLDGLYSLLIRPSLGASPDLGITMYSVTSEHMIPVTVGGEYTGQASFFSTNAAHDYRVTLDWFNSTPTHLSYTIGSDETGPVGSWVHCRTTGTAPAGAAYARIIAYRPTSSADEFCIACLGISPGDFGRWFLPSLAPRLIDFDTAPTANKRLVFSASSCKRWARVALNRDQQAATVELLGDTTVSRMALREALFLP